MKKVLNMALHRSTHMFLMCMMHFLRTHGQSHVTTIDVAATNQPSLEKHCRILDETYKRGEFYGATWNNPGSSCKWNIYDKTRVAPTIKETPGKYDIYILSANDVGCSETDLGAVEASALKMGYVCCPSAAFGLLVKHWKNRTYFNYDKPSYIVSIDGSTEYLEITPDNVDLVMGTYVDETDRKKLWIGKPDMQVKRFIFAKRR